MEVESEDHPEYQHKGSSCDLTADNHILLTALCPLQLCDGEKSIFIWKNPAPSSVRFGNLSNLNLEQTPESIKHLRDSIQRQTDELVPTTVTFRGNELQVHHSLKLTMINCKIRAF